MDLNLNSVEEKALGTVINTFVAEAFKSTKSIFSDFGDEIEQFYNKGLKEYLVKQKDDYAKIKTLLRGNTPVYLYDIYYPIKLQSIQRGQKTATIDTDYVGDMFKISNCITIIGDAGSGKSTLVKHLFLNCIHRSVAIPILVELRYLNDYGNNISDYIFGKIFENKLTKNADILNRLMENGKFAFFLDGFDELKADIKNNVITTLTALINKFPQNKYVITTRPYSDIENLQLFHNLHVKQLSYKEGDIEKFVFKQLQAEQELAEKIKRSLATNKSTYINSFLVNPLLLSLYILTFQSNAEIPNKKYIFYRRVINALFSEHDSKTKLGFVRQKISGLNQEQFEEILKLFCFLSYYDSEFSWDTDYVNHILTQAKTQIGDIKFDNTEFIQDLKSAVALWTEDNGILSFAHRSLQEYFAALFVKTLPQSSSELIYSEIIEKFSLVTKLTDVENFLSLCEEMDPLNYRKYHYLPLLKELRAVIKTTSDKALVKSFLEFFVHAIGITEEGRRTEISVSQRVYRTIHIHIPFTQKLHDILSMGKRLTSKEEGNTSEPRVLIPEGIQIEKIINGNVVSKCPKIVVDYYLDRALGISKKFSKFIDEKITETEKFIKKEESIGSGVRALLSKRNT